MKATQSNFGKIGNTDIHLFRLQNANGTEVTVTNYGATITSILIPNKEGKLENIACGFDTLDGYFSEAYTANAPYFGGTIGRYCSQIKDASFELNGKKYNLAKNCGENNLHGGKVGFDKKIWNAEILDSNAVASVKMTLLSENLEEGFPGDVNTTVTFTLTDANELRIDYSATPTEDTPLSLTNHTYFNLSKFADTVENHSVQLFSNQRLQLDETGAATGEIVNVEGAADDLRQPKRIGEVHQAMNDGFEHFYLFDNPTAQLNRVALIANESNDLQLEVFTTEPCMLLYTGKYTSNDIQRENGEQYGKYRGFCCETHRYPNGPNISHSPNSITKAGEEFTSTTVFKFK
ncbi:aldose epimerase family protein [Flavobacterium sp. NG2]|uniref:aldose epimerase family protein n=1 Tax=Flavobacterium sp. NG2 TaxID=3097547 RepID=UPI002A7F8757|nr:aldose epimerase family protein [Flavobacterium sp. NG2]WPR73141.1 aldose epimerase family protein [Flavobacterium sp. NG2]